VACKHLFSKLFFEKFHFGSRLAREHPLLRCPSSRTESAPNRASETTDSSQDNQTRSVVFELRKAEAFTSRWVKLARGTWGKWRRIFRAHGDHGNRNAIAGSSRNPYFPGLKCNRKVPMEPPSSVHRYRAAAMVNFA
jgi:hypothetical protein